MAESHYLGEAVLREPVLTLNHVVEHHRDLSDRATNVDEAKQQEI